MDGIGSRAGAMIAANILLRRKSKTGANMDLKFSKVTRKGPITIITLSREITAADQLTPYAIAFGSAYANDFSREGRILRQGHTGVWTPIAKVR